MRRVVWIAGMLLGLWLPTECGALDPVTQLAGDCTQDGARNISDVICYVRLLFQDLLLLDRSHQDTPCVGEDLGDPGNVAVLDLDGDETVGLSDVVSMADHLFGAGTPPVQGVACFGLPETARCSFNVSCPVVVGPLDRQVRVHVPPDYTAQEPMPLVLGLHPLGWNATGYEGELQFRRFADEMGFLYIYPDGTPHPNGGRFWDATALCCAPEGVSVDDSGYLRSLIDETKERLNVDPRRVYTVGHSNGGFMGYRMACDHADAIAGIVSMAGITHANKSDCVPSTSVHVLQIQGTEDDLTPHWAGSRSVEYWAEYNGCSLSPEPGGSLDFARCLPGHETQVTRFTTGCSTGGSGEFWSVQGGGHGFCLSDNSRLLILDWLFAHPKP